MSSVFTQIIAGKLPSIKIHEDELTISIFPLDPVSLGHTIVIPKVEVNHFFDVDEPHYSRVFENSKKIAIAIKKATGCERVGTMIQGFEVPHFHHHLVPVNRPSDLDMAKASKYPEEEMLAMAEKIRSFLS